jgi:hypothetical protein
LSSAARPPLQGLVLRHRRPHALLRLR